MSARAPRWEVVRSDAGWHARFRSSNGNVIVSSEVYSRRQAAVRAVEIIGNSRVMHVGALVFPDLAGKDTVRHGATRIEVRYLDERGKSDAHPDVKDSAALGAWAYRQPAVKREVDADRKIHAIKELRALTGCHLFDAKVAIETLPGMTDGRWGRYS